MSASHDQTDDPLRKARLNKLFHSTIKGERTLKSVQDGNRFIEALCSQPDPAACLESLASGSAGLKALQDSVRFDVSKEFLNGPALDLLTYLQHPILGKLVGGALLRQALESIIINTQVLWNALVRSHREGELVLPAQIAFGKLLVQLMCLPGPQCSPFHQVAQEPRVQDRFLKSSDLTLRTLGSKIKHVLSTTESTGPGSTIGGPGGRHDNDFSDFRQIAILPTADELVCEEPPFLRLASVVDDSEFVEHRLAVHLDNQFRLYREDMLSELREELEIARGQKKGRHRGIVIDGLNVLSVDCGNESRRQPWGLRLQCIQDLPQLRNLKPKDRKPSIESSQNLLRHQSLACLIIDGEIMAFPTIHRDTELLASRPSIISLKFMGAAEASIAKTMLKLKTAGFIKLIQIDTAVYAYQPVLQSLQQLRILPLADELLYWTSALDMELPHNPLDRIIERLKRRPDDDVQSLVQSSKSIILDRSQTSSLISTLKQTVSLIQGPPGTGKSFIGALTAKIIHQFTKKTILVVCYTNHALDQFLEDLLDIGIPESAMLRLGSSLKTAPRLKKLGLHEQAASFKMSGKTWSAIQPLKQSTNHLAAQLEQIFQRFRTSHTSNKDVLEYLEFLTDDNDYFGAFTLPKSEEGVTMVGRRGRAIHADYLLHRWSLGQDRGIFASFGVNREILRVWQIPRHVRQSLMDKWRAAILEDRVAELCNGIREYTKVQDQLDQMFKVNHLDVVKSKRVVGCTTTAAAKYSHELQAMSRDVLLVEEAGEILENHVLTALGDSTKQLILIGDHKQLRPKVKKYQLTVAKGEGYDFDRSLFERLVLKGFPTQVLAQQHRMRPEISSLVRSLTYPDLLDAPKTKGRPDLRGFQGNLIFVDHLHPEDEMKETANWKDMTSLSSKQNAFEADMVFRCVRYLMQQGYSSEKLVVLTPYVGQLQLLRKILSQENDPILNELDTADLIRAGILPPTAASKSRRKLLLASIDNYQGEESDIVVVSLTRSNENSNIGFMDAPERLNVLLSRARNALIMIGNSQTFIRSRKGNQTWTQLFAMLENGGHIYKGYPLKCEKHPERTTIMCNPVDFDAECPDGGCKQPCNALLNCKVHTCPSSCHQLSDHSQVTCLALLHDKCEEGHVRTWKCHEPPPKICHICQRAAKEAQKKQERELKLQQKRDAEAAAHAQKMATLEADLKAKQEDSFDSRLSEDRAKAIQQKKEDIQQAEALALRSKAAASAKHTDQTPTGLPRSTPSEKRLPNPDAEHQQPERSEGPEPRPMEIEFKSEARDDWEHQKRIEGAGNQATDSMMDLVGLEDVKSQILRIKAKIDTSKRQHSDVAKERFNVAFLGNPGTGKTTVARLYARILTSLDVLPGAGFVETSGSRLTDGGVAEAKKHIEDLQKGGGGAMFIDEAYQLTQGASYGGRQVLNFLLAEMENNVGKIVFIVAGYNREMESFFEHNPGLPSRVPYRLRFEDYQDFELLWFLQQLIHKKWHGRMLVEDGSQGLYMRIAVRRVGRGRGRPGFGNARALETAFSRITERQADRLKGGRKRGLRPDDFYLCKEDLIGPEASHAKILNSAAWKKIQGLTGLQAVKDSLEVMVHRVVINYKREIAEKEPVEVSLNSVFLGNPGTGKTSVAKLYGQILVDLGLLSNGEVVTKNPSDFVGAHLGESEKNTKAILASTVGKVLIIDEAYMLYAGDDGGGNRSDSFKTAVIDTIVAEVQSVPGEDRCVLLLGYRDKMETMFRNVNPGLSRRFKIDDAFQFDDFSEPELREILESKMKQQDLGATEEAKTVAMEILNRARVRPHFGNAGEVENLLGAAKGRFQRRQNAKPVAERSFDFMFEQQDFDPDFDRVKHAVENLKSLFEDVVGCEEVVAKLAGYQQVVQGMKLRNIDPRGQIPMNFLFKGPPGTGKTTTARKMGQVYYDMGFLSSAEVFECSATDLIGSYVGHTGPKTVAQLDKALGKILFIDEAYRLSEGHFASEAVNELVDQLTKPKYLNKIVVILAGYDKDINKLISTNPGLSSRFPEEIAFENLKPEQGVELLRKKLEQKNVEVTMMSDTQSPGYHKMCDLFKQLAAIPSFGNGREVETLAKNMLGFVYRQPVNDITAALTLTEEDALRMTKTMLYERQDRSSKMPDTSVEILPRSSTALPEGLRPPWAPSGAPPATAATDASKAAVNANDEKDSKTMASDKEPLEEHDRPQRDAGVSDAVWNQLQSDISAQEEQKRQDTLAIQRQENDVAKAHADATAKAEALERLEKQQAEKAIQKRILEQKREQARRAKAEKERLEEEIRRKKEETERQRMREEKVQMKLRQMGRCVQGFRWIKQAGGWRCGGGSHFVGDGEVAV